MKKIIIPLMICLLLPSVCIAQSAKDAVRALKKVDAKCKVGTTLKDYLNAVADAKFEVDLFLKSKEAQKNQYITGAIQSAMSLYENAGRRWMSGNSALVYETWEDAGELLEQAVDELAKE